MLLCQARSNYNEVLPFLNQPTGTKLDGESWSIENIIRREEILNGLIVLDWCQGSSATWLCSELSRTTITSRFLLCAARCWLLTVGRQGVFFWHRHPVVVTDQLLCIFYIFNTEDIGHFPEYSLMFKYICIINVHAPGEFVFDSKISQKSSHNS